MGKLHDQMQEDLLLKAYSPHTQRAYLRCARHFASHYMRSPEEMGEQEIRCFLLHLVREWKASPATLGMYVNALEYTQITDRLVHKLVSPLDMIHPAS